MTGILQTPWLAVGDEADRVIATVVADTETRLFQPDPAAFRAPAVLGLSEWMLDEPDHLPSGGASRHM